MVKPESIILPNTSKRVTLFGCPIDCLTMQETLEFINESIQQNKQIKHVVVNVAKIVYMQKDLSLREAVLNSDLINVDGMPLVWLSKFFKNSLPERVAGIDLMENLVKLASEERYKIFLLGAEEEIVSKLADKYINEYGNDLVAGYLNGFFPTDEEKKVAKIISDSGAQILFVAMPSPQKEIFLEKYKNLLNVAFVMGVGGSFDVLSGFTKRAPIWMQKISMEWLYRLLQEPKRLGWRYLKTNILFLILILKWLVIRIFKGK